MRIGDHEAVRQEGDEYVCRVCHKRWDVHEEPPACEAVRVKKKGKGR